mmetsp:Transcript_7319/g.22315  ORF Transcript_7319/g.22315 Transcript_7319/m.22315 type:complete len:146 (+) Transcript_7319:137-574(+)
MCARQRPEAASASARHQLLHLLLHELQSGASSAEPITVTFGLAQHRPLTLIGCSDVQLAHEEEADGHPEAWQDFAGREKTHLRNWPPSRGTDQQEAGGAGEGKRGHALHPPPPTKTCRFQPKHPLLRHGPPSFVMYEHPREFWRC